MDGFRPKGLLDYLLEANTLTPDQLEKFIQANHDEGLYFDYKNGKIATQAHRDEGRQTIREYVSGFANSDGGVLLIGVNEDKPRGIAPCDPHIGGLPIEQWASRCLQSMAGYFSPQPRFQVIQHPQGHVLAITVARAPSLVPCVESRELRYFFRIDDSTLRIPEYLIADLVLGRRQHPLLDAHYHHVTENKVPPEYYLPNNYQWITRVSFDLMVENLSLVAAEHVEVGMVAWSLNADDTEINRHLRAYVDIVETSSGSLKTYVVHKTNEVSFVGKPFKKNLITIGSFDLLHGLPSRISCAVYFICKGSPPTWFQLRYVHSMGTGRESQVTLTPMGTERPKVVWD